MSDSTPTLNRAANQMQSHGVCRFDRDDLGAIVLESGMGPVKITPDAVAVVLGAHLDVPMHYWGVDMNDCFTFREGKPPRMSGRKAKVSRHIGDALPYLSGGIRPRRKKRDSGDGAPA